ncbi:MAG TPA: hypothetical protein VN903_15755, partial [Polyangia bacterium]|nr:hypothetical protein [Polyangia bacterium]
GLAFQLTGDRAHAERGVRLWRALLEDVDRIGDRKACVPGASPEQMLAAVRRDTGYAIRFIGPHAALAYDWLHDAPGVTEALRQQSRTCLFAWSDWYTRDGYLHDQPGANYHAGFALAKTLIAVATAGEGADPSDPVWREVIEDLVGRQLLTNGLAADAGGIPHGGHHGVLVGGDWAEGWQYGPLSVIEYALAARALEQQGVRLPEMHAWAGDLTRRFLHARTPTGDQMYVAGDLDSELPHAKPMTAPLLATLLVGGAEAPVAWATFLLRDPALATTGTPAFDALAEAASAAPADPLAPSLARSTWFLARGTRNLYARTNWGRDALWAVFTSAPRQVADHQHLDASNFVLSRGADPLVVDPSPYGARSTLTGNALTVDSAVVGPRYKPSQTPWSEADLPWARATRSGVVAARADLARAFHFSEARSDVKLARRDWVLLSEGEVIVIDRATPVAPGQSAYLRFRTPATLATEGGIARGKVGASALAIHLVSAKPQTAPDIHAIPRTPECAGEVFGACAGARFPVGEYAMKLTGPEVLAVHVLDALGADEPPARVAPIGDGLVGASVARGKQQTFVVEPADAAAPDRLSYAVPGAVASRHVVFDAPADDAGRTQVVADAKGDQCALTLVAAQGGDRAMLATPAIFTVGAAAAGCTVAADVALAMDGADGPAPAPSGLALPSAQPRSKVSGGCGCALSQLRHKKIVLALSALVGVLIVVRRRRPRR